jgi:hypothetical protein
LKSVGAIVAVMPRVWAWQLLLRRLKKGAEMVFVNKTKRLGFYRRFEILMILRSSVASWQNHHFGRIL